MNGLSSPITPFSNYTNSIELLAFKVDLWWTVDVVTKEITFELHMATTGWIGLGISPAGGMPGADIGVGWVNQSGYLTFQDRYAYGYATPVIDNTTTDWFGLQGREENGWTAIQFKRLLDTCDSMDYPIKSGSNILIFAWGLVDPDPSVPNDDIVYHGDNRSSRVIPLQSYIQPQSEDKYAGLDTVEFRANNYTLPTNQSTYYCKIFKIPNNFPENRHAIAREILINSSAANLVFHLTLNECDPTSVFDDNNLPQGPCDDNPNAYALCTFNIVIGWATGGDYLIEFPEEAGLPIGLNFSIKYYMLQINYYNADSGANYTDNSGIRLYVGNELRQYDLGGFTLGVDSTPSSIVIPPNVSAFSIDSYCTADASRYDFPQSGLTIVWFFGHTHLQGQSLWTKAIYNQTAIGYLFNAESYYPNHQFENRLPQPFKVYPGDEFATRCVYNTMNKSEVTLGGRLPSQEMCVQVFTYYPRVSNLYACASTIHPLSWMTLLNVTVPPTDAIISQWALATNWTSNLATQWQTFYNTAARITAYGRAGFYNITVLPSLPTYKDLNIEECKYQQTNSSTNKTGTTTTTTITTSTSVSHNLVVHPAAFVLSLFILSLMNGIII